MYHVTHEYPDRWGGARTIAECTERWIGDVSISLKHVANPDHMLLIYDYLVSQPETTTYNLCDFVGIPFEENVITDFSKAYWENVAEKDASWTANAGKPMSADKAGSKFNSYLDEAQRSYVSSAIEEAGLTSIGKTPDENDHDMCMA